MRSKKEYNKLIQIEKEQIITAYYDTDNSFKELSNLLNVSERSISRVLIENGINTKRKNKYTLNSNYFDCIDNEKKAYFLGFLFADGFVGDSKANNIVFSLCAEDVYILDIFKKEIAFTGNIRTTINSGFVSVNKQCVINFSDKHMAEILRNYGLFKERKITMTIPNCISNILIHHFVRGYFDGDGGVCVYDKKSTQTLSNGIKKEYMYKNKIKIDIICGRNFGIELVQLIQLNQYSFSKCKTSGLEYLSLHSNDSIKLLTNYIYKDATIFLIRKQEKLGAHDE